jgi:hypothetical protein
MEVSGVAGTTGLGRRLVGAFAPWAMDFLLLGWIMVVKLGSRGVQNKVFKLRRLSLGVKWIAWFPFFDEVSLPTTSK